MLMQNMGNQGQHNTIDADNTNKVKKNDRHMNHTIDVQEMNAESINDTVSAGGTRYMVKLKGGLPKFYGDASDSQSQYQKGNLELTGDNQSRIDYDNISAHHSISGGSALNNP